MGDRCYASRVCKLNAAAEEHSTNFIPLQACTYNVTVGPICYAIVAEIPSTRLRQKTVVLARNFYNLASIVGNVLTPRMLNPGAWNCESKIGLLVGFC
jgi:hypothetical protein